MLKLNQKTNPHVSPKIFNFLAEGAKSLGIDLSPLQITQLCQYLDYLRIWNKQLNLCANASYETMLAYHLLDSLSILHAVELAAQTVLDVGTGAGLPGIPLAICSPTARITLLDPKSKKLTFVRSALNNLQLTNVQVVQARVEAYLATTGFDFVISRAFADLAKLVKLAGHLCNEHGKLLAMKTDPSLFGVGAVYSNYKILEVRPVQVPYIAKQRTLVVLGRI